MMVCEFRLIFLVDLKKDCNLDGSEYDSIDNMKSNILEVDLDLSSDGLDDSEIECLCSN